MDLVSTVGMAHRQRDNTHMQKENSINTKVIKSCSVRLSV